MQSRGISVASNVPFAARANRRVPRCSACDEGQGQDKINQDYEGVVPGPRRRPPLSRAAARTFSVGVFLAAW